MRYIYIALEGLTLQYNRNSTAICDCTHDAYLIQLSFLVPPLCFMTPGRALLLPARDGGASSSSSVTQ